MRTVNAFVTHLSAGRVEEDLNAVRAVAPDAYLVVCHGGERAEFDRIDAEDKIFVDDPTLRGAPQSLQSWTQIFEQVEERYFRADKGWEALYLFEYDHVVLDGRFEARLAELALLTGADFLGKNCVDRTGTNWEHYVRYRADPTLLAHLRSMSVREDPTRLFGCLGNGMWLSRRALESYVAVGQHPPCYNEVYVPTLLHHLGMKVVDVDAHGELYRYVRWLPEFSSDQVIDAARRGATFVHPVKRRTPISSLAGTG